MNRGSTAARWRLAIVARPSTIAFWRELSPAQLFVLSFAVLITGGMLGFKLLPGLYTGAELSWLDALFTATSAVCVTGLIVVDTATYFTRAGQAWILLLVQLGGLGLLVLTSMILLSIGRRLSLRHQQLVHTTSVVAPQIDVRRLVRSVLVSTFIIEGIGATALYAAWIAEFGWIGALWPAVFHAVSAFCNAGFSIFSNSLMNYSLSATILVPVMTLIVLGGLGFLTMVELTTLVRREAGEHFRLSLHTRLVLLSSAVLIVGGWIVFGLFEWTNTLAGMSPGDKLANALFASITPRTAGFNTVDYANVTEPAAFATILLMIVGGAPGSTAGGLKVTTVALLIGLAISRLRGEAMLNAWSRSVPAETVQRAIGLTVLAGVLLAAAILLLVALEVPATPHLRTQGSFLRYMFEASSAFATVGLSMGETPFLSLGGRILIIVLMFVGRVGLLTTAAAIASERRHPHGFRYGYEDVAIG